METLTLPSSALSALRSLVAITGPRDEFPVLSPLTGQPFATLPACTEADVRHAVETARAAQPRWAATSPTHRRQIVLRFHDLLLERQDDLLDLMQIESGRARMHAAEELFDVALNARHYAFRARGYLRARRRRGLFPGLTRTWEWRHPLGVVGLITPWNYPLTLPLSDALPALLAGNTVVLKPAEQTSFTALRAIHMLYEAGLPEDCLRVVTGEGERLGPALIEQVDFIGFTGSTAVGREVAKQAAGRLIPCALELGGKNPLLVFDDAPLERTVSGAVRACFTNAGQLCVATERIYVQAGIYDRFVSAFVASTRALKLGADPEYRAEMGSLASYEQLEKSLSHVEDARSRGATLLVGGSPRPDLGPFFFEPTILQDVTPDMLVAREETFGPVVAIYRFETEEEAIAAANDSPYGLNASVWTGSEVRGRRIAQHLQCGTVNVNEAYGATWGSTDAPMGGMKASGLGRRHGHEGFLKYTQSQTISAQRFLPIAPPFGMPPRHFAGTLTRLFRLFRHIPGLR